ncbi:hypothetical protein BDV19DRAFT_389205 [Aspergillus venezuelensis]
MERSPESEEGPWSYPFSLHHLIGPSGTETGRIVPTNSLNVRQGRYIILSTKDPKINACQSTEEAVKRALFHQNSPTQSPAALPVSRHRSSSSLSPESRSLAEKVPDNERHFRDAVFERDNERCVITGQDSPSGRYTRRAMAAAHIFPVSRIDLPAGLFSAQNGLILAAAIHECWDAFEVTVNPDRSHRILFMGGDAHGINGRVLARSTKSGFPDHQVSDDCLRWHYRQAILTHMRGEGEKPWEENEDLNGNMNAIRSLPEAGEILEAELGNRLGAYVDVEHDHGLQV